MNNNEKRNVTIRIAEVYPNNCSEQKYENVTKRTERYMRRWEIREESRARKNRRYGLCTFDENVMGECEGAYTPSHEDDICGYTETEILHMAIEALPDYEKELIERHYLCRSTLLCKWLQSGYVFIRMRNCLSHTPKIFLKTTVRNLSRGALREIMTR